MRAGALHFIFAIHYCTITHAHAHAGHSGRCARGRAFTVPIPGSSPLRLRLRNAMHFAVRGMERWAGAGVAPTGAWADTMVRTLEGAEPPHPATPATLPLRYRTHYPPTRLTRYIHNFYRLNTQGGVGWTPRV